jgi:K(+)-stimulated pyrophosphate-energized sodium pump
MKRTRKNVPGIIVLGGALTALFLPLLVSFRAAAGEAELVLPRIADRTYLGVNGQNLLMVGLGVCVLGMLFGFAMYMNLSKLPVHKAMLEVSELIYATCKTYLLTQGKFLLILELFIGTIIIVYFYFLRHFTPLQVLIIMVFNIIGILGSYSVAWFGMRINTFANSRAAFASLGGKPFPVYAIPIKAGISVGMLLICIELVIMLIILLFVPGKYSGPCFIGFAIGESLGAAALRIAGGIFTKIADIGSDLMKIVFKIKEDDARNPGVIADCVGDNAGDSVGPTADGFETYGVTGVALITFIVLAVAGDEVQIDLLVWIFMMRIGMIVTSALAYGITSTYAKATYGKSDGFNFEIPLTALVWITSLISIGMTFLLSCYLIPGLGDGTLWWKLAAIISCGTIAGALIPELVKVFTSVHSAHVREVLNSSREGGASLNILSGLVAGNFSAYWMGIAIIALMAVAYLISTQGLSDIMQAPAVFSFGLVAFGFLGMGPVTIAVDSYGPVSDNAQSIYELSLIETRPNIKEEIKKDFGFEPRFDKAKDFLEQNDGCGNTFKATAKPVLIGTAVTGATTLIFSTIMLLTGGLKEGLEFLSLLYPPFMLGLITGGAVIYWFTGASIQAVTTGAYQAVEFIKKNIKLDDSVEKASLADSKRVVEICTQYAQKGMFNIFIAVFFSTLAFACVNPFFFIGYLITIAVFGLYQAIFMANAGGAWDNAKKLVETELNMKGTPLHDATVVGDTVGDPFKDTSSVSMNPVIKFTTLFGLLAVELAVEIKNPSITYGLAAVFFLIAVVFVYRSFYNMRIASVQEKPKEPAKAASE